MYYAHVKLQLEEHFEYMFMYLTNLKNKYDIILEFQWLKKHNLQINWINKILKFDTNHCLWHCFWHHLLYVHAHDYMNTTWYKLSLSDSMTWLTSCNQLKLNAKNHKEMLLENNKQASFEIYQIKAELFYMLAWKWNHEIFIIIMKDIKKILNSKSYVDSQSFISEKYHDLIDVFEKKKADKLTFYWKKYDIEINLKSDKMSNFESLYSMS